MEPKVAITEIQGEEEIPIHSGYRITYISIKNQDLSTVSKFHISIRSR